MIINQKPFLSVHFVIDISLNLLGVCLLILKLLQLFVVVVIIIIASSPLTVFFSLQQQQLVSAAASRRDYCDQYHLSVVMPIVTVY